MAWQFRIGGLRMGHVRSVPARQLWHGLALCGNSRPVRLGLGMFRQSRRGRRGQVGFVGVRYMMGFGSLGTV